LRRRAEHTHATLSLRLRSRLLPGPLPRVGVLGLIVVGTILLAFGSTKQETLARPAPRPNILFIMTDDQPTDTMVAMPKVRNQVRDEGMTLRHAYVSQALCCPSRASTLRGQYPHNTGVMRNRSPNGGVETFRATGGEDDAVGEWLQEQGYSTALIGKYMNGYDASYKPPGWSYWYARAAPRNPGKKVNDNGDVVDLAGDSASIFSHTTAKAMGYLDRNTDRSSDGPFALFFWTGKPHLPAGDYAEHYANMYSKARLGPPPSFNEADVSDKPGWVRNLDRIGKQERAQLREWHRNQLRSVRELDDAVGAMLELLRSRGELGNTFIVFTTDNGTLMGEHRHFGRLGAKNTAYEEAANVLMYVRGPGVPAGSTSRKLVLNNDLAPTFVRIAGGSPPAFVDGRNLLRVWRNNPPASWRTAIMNEHPIDDSSAAPPYHALMTERYTYVEYENGERELYNRAVDPYELESKHADPAYGDTMATLSLRLQGLKGCKAEVCRAAENGP
jgi:N-acetylglucosamine-6-sulfatase